MAANKSIFATCFIFLVLVFASSLTAALGQDTTAADIKYEEEYNRALAIGNSKDQPAKQAEKFLTFFKDNLNADPKIMLYADGIFLQDLEKLNTQKDYAAVASLAERAVKLRPLFGEAYLHYGFALKNQQKLPEAINAFAKCSVIRNQYMARAKQQLDLAYRAAHNNSLVGEDKLIIEIKKQLKQ